MRLDLKLAVIQSGQPQYAIAQQIGVPESRLSKFIHGYGTLRQDQIARLHALLGLTDVDEPPEKSLLPISERAFVAAVC